MNIDNQLLFGTFTIGPSGGKLSEKEMAEYRQAKAVFLRILRPNKGGPDLVMAVFELADQLTADYLQAQPVACHEGCGGCCYQMVCCCTLEMSLIARYLKDLPKTARRPLQVRIKREALKFGKAYGAGDSFAPKQSDDLRLRLLHSDRACIYLTQSQRCAIYPVRPIDCRVARSTVQCGLQTSQQNVAKPRLFFDQIASDAIMDEERRVHGRSQVTPLIGWPNSRQFRDCF